MDVAFEGKVKETSKQPEKSESAMVGWQIWQVSNHKQANKKIGISNNAREKTSKYNEETELKAKKKSRKLVNLLRAEVIIDDEKYFCFDGDNLI